MLPECQFMMCGDGPMMNFLQQEIDSKNLAQRVHIINRIDNAMEFYSEIDALVIPSEIEGLPLVLLEAMALGLRYCYQSRAHPAHHIPWPKRVLIRTGRYSSASGLAHMLIQLPTEHKKRIGEIARQTVVKEYNIGTCAESYHSVFLSSLGRARHLELSE